MTKWPLGMTYDPDSDGAESEVGTGMSEMTLRMMEWMGAWIRSVSRMHESRTVSWERKGSDGVGRIVSKKIEQLLLR